MCPNAFEVKQPAKKHVTLTRTWLRNSQIIKAVAIALYKKCNQTGFFSLLIKKYFMPQ